MVNVFIFSAYEIMRKKSQNFRGLNVLNLTLRELMRFCCVFKNANLQRRRLFPLVNNVFSERCFGQLDAVSRLHRNLKFVLKETTVMAAQNKFWPWFKERDQHMISNLK